MSWLVIDAGNTAIKWARSDAEGLRFLGTGVEMQVSADMLIERLAASWTVPVPTAAFGVSVARDATVEAIEEAVRRVAGIGVTWFRAQPHFEGRGVAHAAALINGYTDPLQLGPDRWHAMIAACARYPDESIVLVSAGTATTVECIRAEPLAAAVFLGGVIAPGFELMRTSLATGTARLPAAQGESRTHPRNTDDAIASGVLYAQLGLVENLAREFAAELEGAGKEAPKLVLTGGAARPLVAPLTRSLLRERAVACIVLEENLVLRGVALRAHNEGMALPAALAP